MAEAAFFFAEDDRHEDGVVGMTICHLVSTVCWGGMEAGDLCRNHAADLAGSGGAWGLLAWLQ
jgi:hypothetical protein